METFDFKDGNGPVPAHRHKNKDGSMGGWVAETAQVSGAARVSGDAWVYGAARVYGDAWVSGAARVSGDAWVYGDAQVYGAARVSGDAWVYGDAQVYGDAWVYGDARVYAGNLGGPKLEHDYLVGVGPIGSRRDTTLFSPGTGFVFCGCFAGTMKEFKAQVKATYKPGTLHRIEYDSAIRFFESVAKARKPKRKE